jgi:hypothetical protein
MDFNSACLTLEINYPFSLSDLKKQYRIMALKNHPDKHIPDIDDIYSEKFKNISASYEYLNTFLEENNDSYQKENNEVDLEENNDYNSLFTGFLSSFFTNNQSEVHKIISTIINDCQNLSVSLFENMDKDKAIQVFEFINTYHHILYISDDIVEKIKIIINEKIKNDNVIILNPSLDDLLNDNVYMLDFEGEKYYVPLWHDEIYYNCNNNDLIVKCIPDLPENITIDDNNNLIVTIYHSFNNILNDVQISCGKYGNSDFFIPISELKIQKVQKYVFKKSGISIINHNNMYDNTHKSNIIFIINLHQ